MKTQMIQAPMIEDTRPVIYSLPSIKNLLKFIFAAVEFACHCSHYRCALDTLLNKYRHIQFTIVNTLPNLHKPSRYLYFKYLLANRSVPSLPSALVNISSKYQGIVRPVLAGTCVPVSCCRLVLGTTWREKCRVSPLI